MLHYGKNSENELELHLSGDDVAMFYRVILSAGLQERALHGVRRLIEQSFVEEISSPVK